MVIIPTKNLPFKNKVKVGQHLAAASSAMEVCASNKNYIFTCFTNNSFFVIKSFFFVTYPDVITLSKG